jgi:cell division protein FtsB
MTAMHEARLAILQARSRRAAMITLIGGLLVLGAIAFSAWQLRSLSIRKNRLQAEYAAAQADLSKLKQTRSALQADIRAGQDTLARIRLQLATDNVAGAKRTLAVAAVATPAATTVRRVFFQLRGTDQRPLYERCRQALGGRGYRVPGFELVPDRGPPTLNVRYFKATERDEALQVASLVAACAGGRATTTLIGGYDVKPNQYEVWFPPIAAKAAPDAVARSPDPVVLSARRQAQVQTAPINLQAKAQALRAVN